MVSQTVVYGQTFSGELIRNEGGGETDTPPTRLPETSHIPQGTTGFHSILKAGCKPSIFIPFCRKLGDQSGPSLDKVPAGTGDSSGRPNNLSL